MPDKIFEFSRNTISFYSQKIEALQKAHFSVSKKHNVYFKNSKIPFHAHDSMMFIIDNCILKVSARQKL